MGDARERLARPASFVAFEDAAVEQSIGARFEQIAGMHGDRPAVVTPERTVTYDELAGAARRTAAGLVHELGAEWEPVALLVEDPVDAIVAALGILLAGKAYVPLAAADGPDRVRYVLRHCRNRTLLFASQFAPLIESFESPRTLVFEALLDADCPLPQVSPDALAYVIYTSGSTGRPKGVGDTHRNVLHNVARGTNSLFINPEDRMSLVQPLTISASVENIFGALTNGAAVVPFDVRTLGIGAMAEALIGTGTTIYHSVPSLFREVAAQGLRASGLRVVRIGGDRCTPRDVRAFREHCPDDCVLVNGLGTTESGLVRQYFMDKDSPVPEANVPIGYAVPGMDVRIVDESGGPVELGNIGEITVTSRYLAPGYFDDPERTAAAFVDGPTDGERTYLTGDLGRLLDDGCLLHLGRKGLQSKLRGQWIDTSRVASVLVSGAHLADAVVSMRETPSGDVQLVAHIVPAGPDAPTVSALRRAAAAGLPDYMVPSAYVTMDALPLTPAGKVDVRGLPAPGRARPTLDAPFVAARSPAEARVAAIWSAVLDLEAVGVNDRFLDLGGDSLLAARVVSRVVDAFGLAPASAGLAGARTVAEMAGMVLACQAAQMPASDVEAMLSEAERAAEDPPAGQSC